MKKVKLNGKALTKSDICEHISDVYFYVPYHNFSKYCYMECKRILRFLVLSYRPEFKDDYENLFD